MERLNCLILIVCHLLSSNCKLLYAKASRHAHLLGRYVQFTGRYSQITIRYVQTTGRYARRGQKACRVVHVGIVLLKLYVIIDKSSLLCSNKPWLWRSG